MGIAAYNRGTLLIRTQTDRDMESISGERDGRHNREDFLRLRAEVAERDLLRAKRLIGLLRAEKALARERLDAERHQHGITKRMAGDTRRALLAVRTAHNKASKMLRLLTPEQVNELRAALDS